MSYNILDDNSPLPQYYLSSRWSYYLLFAAAYSVFHWGLVYLDYLDMLPFLPIFELGGLLWMAVTFLSGAGLNSLVSKGGCLIFAIHLCVGFILITLLLGGLFWLLGLESMNLNFYQQMLRFAIFEAVAVLVHLGVTEFSYQFIKKRESKS